MINVFELDDLFDLLWHWRCSVSAGWESFIVGLLLFSDSSNAEFVVFCNTVGYCSILCLAFEDFWAVWVFGTWRIICTTGNSTVFLRN